MNKSEKILSTIKKCCEERLEFCKEQDKLAKEGYRVDFNYYGKQVAYQEILSMIEENNKCT